MNRFLCAILLLFSGSTALNAASVTVGLSGDTYTTLQEAVAKINTWGDGNDTIFLKDDQITLLTTTLQVRPINYGSVTIKNADGDAPRIVASAAPVPLRLIDSVTSGSYTYDGLTLLGPAGTVGTQTAFRAEASTASVVKTITIRNCLVTANDGFNAPKTDWGSTVGVPTTGGMDYAILHGDDRFYGKLTVTAENCTFAYSRSDTGRDGNVRIDRKMEAAATPGAFRKFTFKKCLIIGAKVNGISTRDLNEETTVTVQDCLIAKNGGRNMRLWFNDFFTTANYVIKHTIFVDAGNEAHIGLVRFGGNLTMERVTFYGAGLGVYAEQATGYHPNFAFRDIIFRNSSPNSFRYQNGETPNSFTIETSALIDPSSVNPDNPTMVKDAFAAMYGGTGPLTDDPIFVNSDLTTGQLDGKIGFDSTTNDYFDVDNDVYLGKSSVPGVPANALTGGAELSARLAPPPPPPNAARPSWATYE